MSLSLEIVFNYMAIEPVIIWHKLLESHSDFVSRDEKGNLSGINITISNIEDEIKKRRKPHFGLEFKNAVFEYGGVGSCNLFFLEISKCITDIEDAYLWIKPFLELDSFIQGRVFDEEYERWQNAEDVLQYTAVGKSYKHLPMVSNGLPYPLEQMVIDVSMNLGRRILCDGYIESIGSTMWLGKQFWELTGTDKLSVLNAEWLECQQYEVSEVLVVKSQGFVFINSKSKEGEIQEKLRKLLFLKIGGS